MTRMRESGSDVDNLLDVVAHNDAVALVHGAVTGTSPGKRRGLRGCGALAGIGPADFGDDNRFAGLKRLFSDACQLFRRLHILHEQGKDIGLVAVDEVVDEIELLESGFVTGRQDIVNDNSLGRPRSKKENPIAPLCAIADMQPSVR